MKKLALLCVLALITVMLPMNSVLLEQAAPVRVYGLVGPTGMSLAPLIAEDDPAYEYSLAAAPEELVGIIASGSFDIAALPTNRWIYGLLPPLAGCRRRWMSPGR